jgi:hypothetical protein
LKGRIFAACLFEIEVILDTTPIREHLGFYIPLRLLTRPLLKWDGHQITHPRVG